MYLAVGTKNSVMLPKLWENCSKYLARQEKATNTRIQRVVWVSCCWSSKKMLVSYWFERIMQNEWVFTSVHIAILGAPVDNENCGSYDKLFVDITELQFAQHQKHGRNRICNEMKMHYCQQSSFKLKSPLGNTI